jgi:hypothetical protein
MSLPNLDSEEVRNRPEFNTDAFRNEESSAEMLARRRALCDACEHKTSVGLCGKCFCIIALKTKWASQSCPIHKW